MSRARFFISVGLLTIAAISLGLVWKEPASAQDKGKEKAALPKYDYKIVQPELDKTRKFDAAKTEQTFNKLGEDGWEWINTVSEITGTPVTGAGGFPSGGSDTSTSLHFIFKRIKQ